MELSDKKEHKFIMKIIRPIFNFFGHYDEVFDWSIGYIAHKYVGWSILEESAKRADNLLTDIEFLKANDFKELGLETASNLIDIIEFYTNISTQAGYEKGRIITFLKDEEKYYENIYNHKGLLDLKKVEQIKEEIFKSLLLN